MLSRLAILFTAAALAVAVPAPALGDSTEASNFEPQGVACPGFSYDSNGGMATAHRTLPCGTVVEVCGSTCGQVVVVDRGPFVGGRDLDLTYTAFGTICEGSDGVCNVTYNVVGSESPNEEADSVVAPADETTDLAPPAHSVPGNVSTTG